MKTALTIAGSDPTGGAGLQADIRVFTALGVHGFSVPSALTAQSTEGVASIMPVERDFFRLQLEALVQDSKPDALKTGMLYSPFAVDITAEIIKKYSLANLVVDPVTVSSTGMSLVEDGTLELIKKILFPLARVVTPNIYEASVLTGVNIETEKDALDAAKALKAMGPEAVIVTGGHLEGIAMDLYFDGSSSHRLESAKMPGEFHGTGCAFSAAITAFLALAHSPLESARRAKEFTQGAIRKAYHVGRGMGMLNFLK